MMLLLTMLFTATLAQVDGGEKTSNDGDPFVDRVVSVQVGAGGGYNRDALPDIVLGPPKGGGKLKSSRDVFSLGHQGVIVLEFVDNEVYDGEGPDFIVFENPFLEEPGNDPELGFFELAKVEVSQDGIEWKAFAFDTGTRAGCAGRRPVLANADENKIDPTDPAKAGGDLFDLKEVGMKTACFVRITDVLSPGGAKDTAGFDLDAVVAVHSRKRARETK